MEMHSIVNVLNKLEGFGGSEIPERLEGFEGSETLDELE